MCESLLQSLGNEALTNCWTSDSGGAMWVPSWPWNSWPAIYPCGLAGGGGVVMGDCSSMDYGVQGWSLSSPDVCLYSLHRFKHVSSVCWTLPGLPLVLDPFCNIMDTISRLSRCQEVWDPWNLISAFFLQMTWFLALAPSVCDLQQAQGQCAAKCEADRMGVQTLEFEAMVPCRKTADCPHWGRGCEPASSQGDQAGMVEKLVEKYRHLLTQAFIGVGRCGGVFWSLSMSRFYLSE